MNKELPVFLSNIVGTDDCRESEPMSLHTSMKVGGCASCFVTPRTEEDIAEVIKLINATGERYYILGNGSNVIFRDEGYDGVVVCLLDNYSGTEVIGENGGTVIVRAKAGTLNKDFSDEMIRLGLSGFEFASGIPGSIGGAAAMNAGAYDGEFKNIVKEVKLMDMAGNTVVKANEEMDFGYRHSLVSGGGYIVLEATFAMRRDDPEKIRERVDDLTRRRTEKQPLEYPSCGSTFKRPEGYFAGKLITDAGLKGTMVGGAQVSEKHAGFIINKGNATASDVLGLIELVKERVLESQGVRLECEVKIL